MRSAISSTISGGSNEFPGDVGYHDRRIDPIEPGQRLRHHMRLPDPWRLKFGTEHDQQQHGPTRNPLYQAIQQFSRTWINPVDVVEDHQHRLVPRKTLNPLQQRLERLLLLALGGDVQRWCEIA